MSIPENFYIRDIRDTKDFQVETFSGYKRSDVMDALLDSMMNGKLENALNWGCELVLSMRINELFDKILEFMIKFIGIHNPNMFLIYEKRYSHLKTSKISPKDAINDQSVRNAVAEIISIACLSIKSKFEGLPKVLLSDLKDKQIIKKLKSNDKTILAKYSQKDDPVIVKIVVNELFHRLRSKNTQETLYFFNWLLTYEKKAKEHFECVPRKITGITKKNQTDFLWFIWQILKGEMPNEKMVSSLFIVAVRGYKRTKNILILFFLLKYLSGDNYNMPYDPLIKRHVVIQAVSKINFLYFDKQEFALEKKKGTVNFSEKKKKKVKEDEKTEKENMWEALDNIFLNKY